MALEHIEQKEAKKRKRYKRNKKYALKEQSSMILDDAFFENYYQFLDSYLIRTTKLNEKIEELERLKNKKK